MNNNELKHYGVKGMRWGHRNASNRYYHQVLDTHIDPLSKNQKRQQKMVDIVSKDINKKWNKKAEKKLKSIERLSKKYQKSNNEKKRERLDKKMMGKGLDINPIIPQNYKFRSKKVATGIGLGGAGVPGGLFINRIANSVRPNVRITPDKFMTKKTRNRAKHNFNKAVDLISKAHTIKASTLHDSGALIQLINESIMNDVQRHGPEGWGVKEGRIKWFK